MVRSVRREVHDSRSMFEIELTCGEEPCDVTIVVVRWLAELDMLVCDECGHCLHVQSISDVEYAEVAPPPALLLAA